MTHHLHMTFDYAKEMPCVSNRHYILNIDVSYATEDRVSETTTRDNPSVMYPKDSHTPSKEGCPVINLNLDEIIRLIRKALGGHMNETGGKCCPFNSQGSSTQDKSETRHQESVQKSSSPLQKFRENIRECISLCCQALSTKNPHICRYKQQIMFMVGFLIATENLKILNMLSDNSDVWEIFKSKVTYIIDWSRDISRNRPEWSCSNQCSYREYLLQIHTILEGIYREHFEEKNKSTTFQEDSVHEVDSLGFLETPVDTGTSKEIHLQQTTPESQGKKTEDNESPTYITEMLREFTGIDKPDYLESINIILSDPNKWQKVLGYLYEYIDMEGLYKSVDRMKDTPGMEYIYDFFCNNVLKEQLLKSRDSLHQDMNR